MVMKVFLVIRVPIFDIKSAWPRALPVLYGFALVSKTSAATRFCM